ncbi:uncharacterized protein NECHADRAFT_81814 [Fusarium vanettenii 77-13-4]|uniref:Uncharacterized protein n=1 Tax=Fusarium vanettenii (strain ATCC MYA-4622 / CBS 123669 / FGSC 9596 / NRRL 45880 / 77-13-4) TaxID=660122 RepID=C7Z9N3_FUSV7|nr:uncharacterized protein NECHADRAFT_81814 [Fusarium vanettenii 77-13-4]EEU39130.1 predicted protein [Fusarium vanettenii 77-13-4]
MIIPLELIVLIAEKLAHRLAQTSPFLATTDDAEWADLEVHRLALINLAGSCKAVHHNIRHLLYTTLDICNPLRLTRALTDILKYPQVGPSIRHIYCATPLDLDASRKGSRGSSFRKRMERTEDIAWVEDTLKQRGCCPPWWHNPGTTHWLVKDGIITWIHREGWIRLEYLEVAFLSILHMATKLESLAFHQVDSGWERLASMQGAMGHPSSRVIVTAKERANETIMTCENDESQGPPRLFLGNLKALQCNFREQSQWLHLADSLFGGGYENLQTLILDGMSLRDMSEWSDKIKVKNTKIEQLYLGSRFKRQIASPLFAKQEWVRGRWLVGGPRLENPQLELAREDEEGWRSNMEDRRRRKSNLGGFKHLRVLDVVVDSPPNFPSRTLVALKDLASSLEVLRVEGYPFNLYIPDDRVFG